MPRLVELLASDSGSIAVELEFDRDEQGIRVLKGSLSTNVERTCERCLGPVSQEISTDFALGVVLTDEDAKQLPGRYEPLLVDPESLEISEVIEEELMLSLPMFAYHETCHGDYQQADQDEADGSEERDEGKENPFSVLSDLKLKK